MGLLDKLSGGGGGKDNKKVRIVVAADKKALGKDAQKLLKRPGISLDKVRSPKAALAAAGRKPQAAVVLLSATKLDDPALDTCQVIASQPSSPPVVVMYPGELLGLRDAALAAGANDVIPFDPPADLFEKIVLRLAGIATRQYPRVSVSFPVRVYDGLDVQTAFAENLSQGGIQLRAAQEIGMGRPVKLELAWPGQPIVVWAVGADAIRVRKAVVTGLRFVGLSAVEMARLEAYLAARGGVSYSDEFEALAAAARLETADVIRLASGVDASSSRALRSAAMRFTNSETQALTGMGGDAADAEPLIAIAVARLKASYFAEELERFDARPKDARDYAMNVAANIVALLTDALKSYYPYATRRSADPTASPALKHDLKSIDSTLKRIVTRLTKSLSQLSPDLAEQVKTAAEAEYPPAH